MTEDRAFGPWREYDRNEHGDLYIGEGDECVCIVTPSLFDVTGSETQRRARLISAAPDLLAVLIAVRDAYQDVLTIDLEEQVEQAIAKATGVVQ